MEISFLKTLVTPATDKLGLAAKIGTVPAFPDGMLESETRTGDQFPRDGEAADISARVMSETGEPESTESNPGSQDTAADPRAASTKLGMLPGFASDQMPSIDAREPHIPKLPSADPDIVQLSEIDPEAKLMPYRNTGAGEPAIASPEFARQQSLPAQVTLPTGDRGTVMTESPLQPADSRDPKNTRPVGEISAEDGNQLDPSRDVPVRSLATNGQISGLTGSQSLPLSQNGAPSQAPSQVANAKETIDPAGETAAMEEPKEAFEARKLMGTAMPIANATRPLPRMTAKDQVDKTPELTKGPEKLDPDAADSFDSVSKTLPAAAVSTPTSARVRQTPVSEGAASPQVEAVRSLSSSASGAKVQEAITQSSTVPSDAVIEFDSAFIQNLTREISMITQAKGIARFTLKPEHLGKIDVEIRGNEGGDDIKLVAETESVKQFLIQSQSRLEQEIRLHGQRLAGLDIGTAPDQGLDREARESQQTDTARTGSRDGADDGQSEQPIPAGMMSGQPRNGARYA